MNPAVSPDGKSIAYITDDDGTNKLAIMSLSEKKKKYWFTGSSADIDVVHNEKVSFSSDGNLLAFSGEKTQKDYIFLYDIKKKNFPNFRLIYLP